MKRTLKTLGIAFGSILVIFILILLLINFSDIPSYDNKAPDATVKMDSAKLAEGIRMANLMCMHCHASNDGKAGGAYMPDGKAFGDIYAPNITQHPEYGIADYTDGELLYLLRTGVKKNGQYSPPWMPKFPHLSDWDIESIVLFLKSGHELVQPSDNNPPPVKPNFLAKMLCRIAFKPLPFPESKITPPDSTDKVALGKYLATAKYDCYGCHSADFKTINVMEPEKSTGYFGGGNKLLNKELEIIASTNLTMDEETGLGKWTENEFKQALKYGIKPDGTALKYPMIPMPLLKDGEVSAIWAYLKSLPVIRGTLNQNQ